MTMTDLVYTQALLLAPDLSTRDREILRELCYAAVVSLERKLRKNVLVKDCHNQFVSAASMYALAAMSEVSEGNQFDRFTAGDLTIQRAKSPLAANCLRTQADMLMAPYVKLSVAFMGV